MKKLVATGPKQTVIVDADMPKIKNPNEVIVKVRYCGVCMSEHYDWSTTKGGRGFGHEPVGVIHELGSAVTGFNVGDRVSGPFKGDAEYVVAEECDLIKIPDSVKDEEAVLEPLGCLISAVSKVRIPYIGAKVAVVGCGYMGCGAISLLKKRGAYVVGVDTRLESLENAKKYGADEIYTPEELLKTFSTKSAGTWATSGGFPLVMEWAETSESLNLAIKITAMCGQLAIGAYHTGEKRLVDVQQLNVKAIDCLSTHPRELDLLRDSCRSAVTMFEKGDWDYQNVTTKVYPITKFDEAQGELTEKYGKWMKALVDWTKFDGEPYIID